MLQAGSDARMPGSAVLCCVVCAVGCVLYVLCCALCVLCRVVCVCCVVLCVLCVVRAVLCLCAVLALSIVLGTGTQQLPCPQSLVGRQSVSKDQVVRSDRKKSQSGEQLVKQGHGAAG